MYIYFYFFLSYDNFTYVYVFFLISLSNTDHVKSLLKFACHGENPKIEEFKSESSSTHRTAFLCCSRVSPGRLFLPVSPKEIQN